MPNGQLWVFSRSREIWRRLEAEVLFFWVTNECVSIHFPTCLRGNFCLLYCLILLQALNCCPQEDAKRYNRNSFVLYRLLSRPSSVNLFFFLSCFCLVLAFFLLFGSMVIINQMICISPVLSSAFVVFFVLCLCCVLCIFHYNHLFLCLLFFVVIRPPWVPQWPQTNKFHSSFNSDKKHIFDPSKWQVKWTT